MSKRVNCMLAGALWVALALSGCSKKPKVALRPMPMPPPSRKVPSVPEPLPPPPSMERASADIEKLPEPVVQPPLEIPEPPKPAPRPKPRVSAQQTDPPEQPAPPTPVPQLGQLMTEEEERTYRQELEQSLRDTMGILQTLGGRRLTADQRNLADRARSFAGQAEAQRATDLLTARNLARRAQILAQELQRTLR